MRKFSGIKSIIPFCLVVLFFNACNQSGNSKTEINLDSIIEKGNESEEKQAEINKESALESVFEPTKECYEYLIQKDTYQVSWIQQGNKLKGSAMYDNYQKDGSHGTLEGEYDAANDLYLFWYSFHAEGMQSVRRLVFKKSGDKLIPGFGDTLETGDTSNIKNLQSLAFDKRYAYKKVDCNRMRGLQ